MQVCYTIIAYDSVTPEILGIHGYEYLNCGLLGHATLSVVSG
jgi:hypothetical protein